MSSRTGRLRVKEGADMAVAVALLLLVRARSRSRYIAAVPVVTEVSMVGAAVTGRTEGIT